MGTLPDLFLEGQDRVSSTLAPLPRWMSGVELKRQAMECFVRELSSMPLGRYSGVIDPKHDLRFTASY